jgi:hypothetical protein
MTIFYRDQLKRNYNLGQYWLEVDIEDVSSFDESLADFFYLLCSQFRQKTLLLIKQHKWLSEFSVKIRVE